MKKFILVLQFLAVYFSVPSQTAADGEAIRNIQWTTKTVAPGVVLKTCQQVSFFNSVQSISMIEIDTLTAQVDFKIDCSSSEYHPVSVFGRRNNAIAAINGTYFMTTGSSVGQSWHYIKIDGQKMFPTVLNEFSTRATGVFTVTDGTVDISTWNQDKEAANAGNAQYALVCGPLMIDDNVDLEMWDNDLTNIRHPRSCVANTADGKVLIVAVDGRQSKYAAGMSLYELRYFLRQLGCVDAMNLDGGGSTALYVAGEPNYGIVNRPIDENVPGKERNVGNILYITPRNDVSKPYILSGKSPGGVGGMRVWLKAGGEITKNESNQLVAPYIFDYTGYNDFELKERISGTKIIWNDDRINSHPTLAFDSASLLASNRKADYSTFYSVNTINKNGTFLGFDEYGSSHPKFRYFLMADKNNVYVHDGSNTTGGVNYAFIPYQDNFNADFNLYSSSYGKKYDTFVLNGKEQLSTTSNFLTRDYITAKLQIGARNSYPVTINPVKDEYYYRGEVAEIIAYPDTLTASEHVRVESYLAVKYGITIDNPEYRYTASYGTRWWDGANAAYKPYSYYITFIGRDDNSGLRQLRAKSIGNHILPKDGCLLTLIHADNNIANDQYFVCTGSTTDDLTSKTTLNLEDGSCEVMSRHWKFNASSSPSQPFGVEIDIPAALSINETNIGIVVKSGTDYTFYQGTLNAAKNKVSVDNITVKKADLMYLALNKMNTGIENLSSGNIKILHDKDNHTISVTGLQDKSYALSIYSVSGILLYEKSGNLQHTSTAGFGNGVYILALKNEGNQIVKREKIIISN